MSRLKTIRQSMPKISQERVARHANITLSTYRKAEAGGKTQYTTAKAILQGLNAILQDHGKEPLGKIEDLDLNLE